MFTGNWIGILFSSVLFVVGMLFTRVHIAFFVIGMIGLIVTIYFIVRIVSDILKRLHNRNS